MIRQQSGRRFSLVLFVSLLLLIWDLYCYPLTLKELLQTVVERDGAMLTLCYVVVSSIAYVSLAYLLLSEKIYACISFAALLASHLIALSFKTITFSEFTVYDYEIIIRAYANRFQAISFYQDKLATALLPSICFYGILFTIARMGPKDNLATGTQAFRACLVSAIIILSFSLIDNSKAKVIPSALQVPSAAIEFYSTPFYQGSRVEAVKPPMVSDYPLHTVMVVDESIRGDYLQINGYPLETTPYIASLDQMVVNYGNAVSLTNLTFTSNYALFSGLRSDQMPDHEQRSRKNPTLFQFAKAAGRKVHIVYSTMHLSDYQDWTEIYNQPDYSVTMVKSYPPASVDYQIVDELEKITSSREPTFTWVNKWGCHIPYKQNFPSDFSASWIGSGNELLEGRRRDYLRCVKWQVDGFIEALYRKLKGRQVIVFYTSDHGVSLDLKFAKSSHGQLNAPPSEQANVPLMLFAFDERTSDTIQRNYIRANQGKMHAGQIFPSILQLWGYGKELLVQYQPTIFEVIVNQSSQRRFLSGSLWNHGRSYLTPFSEVRVER